MKYAKWPSLADMDMHYMAQGIEKDMVYGTSVL